MQRLILLGRVFIASAMIAFGIQHVIYADFVTRLIPKLPASVPAHSTLAYLTGGLLIAVGIVLALAARPARLLAILLGAAILLSFVVLYLPPLVANPSDGGWWTAAFKALTLTGGLFATAATLPSHRRQPGGHPISATFPSDALLLIMTRIFFGSFLILAGILHFIYAPFVDTLVPAWIPGARFWTYFSAVALLAGGTGLLMNRTLRLAALLTGSMIFVWVLALHLPRALGTPADANETTAVFEALACCGIAFILAASRSPVSRQPDPFEPQRDPAALV